MIRNGLPRAKSDINYDYILDVEGRKLFLGHKVWIIESGDLVPAVFTGLSGITNPIGHFRATNRWGTFNTNHNLRGHNTKFNDGVWQSDRVIRRNNG